MRGGFFAGVAAALFAVLAACTTAAEPSEPTITVGGTSTLVDAFERVAAETELPVELLAAMSYVQTRFTFVDSDEHGASAVGLLGLSLADLAAGARIAGVTDEAAATDPEASLRAGAWLVRSHLGADRSLDGILAQLEPRMRAELTTVLARGVDGQDELGDSIVIAARPHVRATEATTTQALGNADYAPALWAPAYSGNYQVASRGLTDITHVVIHTVQGSYSSCINWFKDPEANVSAHYVVRSTDGEVTQMVAEKNVAWHDACFNTKTIGIEHEGFVDAPERWYTEAMYLESAKLAAYLADKYGIPKTRDRILGHGETMDCSSHEDPGTGWNWEHYIDLVTTGGAPRFDAQDITVDAPEKLVSGERATVTVHVTNNGNTAWDLDLTRLGTAAPQDRESAFFVDGDWVGPTRATGTDARVEPGATGTFTFDVVAPAVREATLFDEAFQLVQEGASWFGPEMHVMLQVVPADDATDSAGCSAGGSTGGAFALMLLGLVGLRRRRR